MRYSRAACAIGLVLAMAACGAGPSTTPTVDPLPTPDTRASTTPPTEVEGTNVDIATTEGADERLLWDPVHAAPGGSATTDDADDAGEELASDESPSQQEPTTQGQPDNGTTTTPPNEDTTAEIDGFVDDVADLLGELEAILGDLDADLAAVQDGMNQDEGDIG